MAGKKPMNFVFIMTDQLRPDHLGFGGNPIVQTPHLDALAERACEFTRAYCPSPLCGPSRSSIFTGRMPSAHGNWLNTLGLDWDANTFVHVLRDAGYHTALVGKSHLQEFLSRREVAERRPNLPLDMPRLSEGPQFDRHPYPGVGVAAQREWPANWNKWEDVTRHRDEPLQLPNNYYGFDSVELVCTHADLPEGHYRHWIVDQGGDVTSIGGIDHALDVSADWQQVYKSNVPPQWYTSSYVTDVSLAALDRFASQEAPFFLNVSYPDPHHPFCPPDPYFSMYKDVDVPLPETFNDPHTRSLPHIRRTISRRGANYIGPFLMSPSAEQYVAAARAEYGSITALDEGIGAITARLASLDLLDSTVIVFTSDHGDMFGDHGLMLKFGAHYDGTVRVPLLCAVPEQAPARSKALVSLVDLAPTFLEFAGCEAYVGMHGKSLVPVLQNPATSVRESVLIEEDLPFDMVGVGQNTSIRTLITDDARLTRYGGTEEGELFDLAGDPDEVENLHVASNRTGLRAHMSDGLIDAMITNRNIERIE